MNEFELDVRIFVAESLATNPKSYKHIDEIYNKDIDKYRKIAKASKYYESKIVNEGSIKQTYYFKKLLGLIDDGEIVFNLAQHAYKYVYQYVVSNENISLSKFYKKLISKNENISLDELNGSLLNCILFADSLDKKIVQDEVYNKILLSLKERLDRENLKFNLASIDDLDKKDRELLRKIELNLKRLYLKSYEPFPHTPEKSYMDGQFIKTENLSDLDKRIICYEYIYDLEEVSLISLVENKLLNSKEIQEVFK